MPQAPEPDVAAGLLDEEGVTNRTGLRLFHDHAAFREALEQQEELRDYMEMEGALRPPKPSSERPQQKEEWDEPPQAAEVM